MASLEGKRIAIICADRNAHKELGDEIRDLGGVALIRAILGDIGGVAYQCNAIVVFADGYDAEALAIHLDALERSRDGPTLVVVTDGTPSWNPKLERDWPAVLVPSAEWRTRLIALAAPPTEPELPSTD